MMCILFSYNTINDLLNQEVHAFTS